MNRSLEQLLLMMPGPVPDLCVTAYNLNYYRKRAGRYKACKEQQSSLYLSSYDDLMRLQSSRLSEFLHFVQQSSPYYRRRWRGIEVSAIRDASGLAVLPVIEKEELRTHLEEFATAPARKCLVAHTGGTTGKSLAVYYRWDDVRERLAVLDSFRERFGWRLGKRTAWFSGKRLVSPADEARGKFWKTDHWFNIRYYSTFHIAARNMAAYIEDLNRYQPEFVSGFPSSIFEIAAYLESRGISHTIKPKALFTTSETIAPQQRAVMERQFGARVYDQYSASEGAPFIVECAYGRKHFLPQTGVIEVVDDNGHPAEQGEILVTSFTTKGTPLVRYRIGDVMRFEAEPGKRCLCGSCCPIVAVLEGRVNDYVYSKDRGKINLGNVSNCVKHASGVIEFQVVQEHLDRISVNLVVDRACFKSSDAEAIKRAFSERLGETLVELNLVDALPRGENGKKRIVMNNIKHLL